MAVRYKRLDPPWWLEDETPQQNDANLESITPIFQRDGLYLDRKNNTVWIEYEGKAWRYLHKAAACSFFSRELDLLNAPWYREEEVEAFQKVWHYLPRSVTKQVQDHLFRLECRRMRRETEAFFLSLEDYNDG